MIQNTLTGNDTVGSGDNQNNSCDEAVQLTKQFKTFQMTKQFKTMWRTTKRFKHCDELILNFSDRTNLILTIAKIGNV